MKYHVAIKTERRTDPARQANVINTDIHTQDGLGEAGYPRVVVTPQPHQLHTIGERIDDLSNVQYASEWDESSSYITVIKGDSAAQKNFPLGWPMVSEADYTPPTD